MIEGTILQIMQRIGNTLDKNNISHSQVLFDDVTMSIVFTVFKKTYAKTHYALCYVEFMPNSQFDNNCLDLYAKKCNSLCRITFYDENNTIEEFCLDKLEDYKWVDCIRKEHSQNREFCQS